MAVNGGARGSMNMSDDVQWWVLHMRMVPIIMETGHVEAESS